MPLSEFKGWGECASSPLFISDEQEKQKNSRIKTLIGQGLRTQWSLLMVQMNQQNGVTYWKKTKSKKDLGSKKFFSMDLLVCHCLFKVKYLECFRGAAAGECFESMNIWIPRLVFFFLQSMAYNRLCRSRQWSDMTGDRIEIIIVCHWGRNLFRLSYC